MSNFNTCKSNTVLIIVIVASSLPEVITLHQAEVLVNKSAFINCISQEVKSIQWHHTSPGKFSEYVYAGGNFKSSYRDGRFRVDNDLTMNVFTLVITNVMHEDAGLYECKDDVLSGVFGSTYLTVLDSNPVCTSNMNPNGFVGPNTCNITRENMVFSCAVSFSGNSPILKWSTLNGKQALNRSICEQKDKRINCSLSMKADPSFDGSTFICQTTTLNDARHNCSIRDIRVEYFFGDYEAGEKIVGDNVTCMVASNLKIHYNWTIQQNNEDNIFSTNRMIFFKEPGFYKCSVKYNIRNVTCYAPIVAVYASNIIDDESSNVPREQSNALAIGVSIGVSVCLVAVIAFVIYKKCIKGRRVPSLCLSDDADKTRQKSECLLQLNAITTPDNEMKPEPSLGDGVAYTYFFSFLQMVIPGVWNSFVKEIQRPSAVKEPTEKTFLVKKMLIIIPKSLKSPKKLTDDANIRFAGLSIKQRFHRAGKENRDYTIPIYELTDNESGDVYYFVTDIPSCLFAIREAYDSELNIMSRDDVYRTRDDFVRTLKELLNHPKNHSQFANQWELLLWPDEENDRMELSEFVCQEIKSKELAVKFTDILIQPITGEPIPDSERPCYAIRNRPRGHCVIISNFDFQWMKPRSISKTEIEELKKLFEGLKFKVEVKTNLTADGMTKCLTEYRDRDHSASDAFVCCLLSRGEKGRIKAADGQISVIQLMELFYDRNCSGLAGKPKLFFIGTSQGKGEDEKYERIQSTSTNIGRPDDELLVSDIARVLVQSSANFIVSYACLPETVDWHNSKQGGLYVQALCRHLNQDVEIDAALQSVNQEVTDLLNTYDKEGERCSIQDPFHILTPPLYKRLFLRSA